MIELKVDRCHTHLCVLVVSVLVADDMQNSIRRLEKIENILESVERRTIEMEKAVNSVEHDLKNRLCKFVIFFLFLNFFANILFLH